MISSSRFDIQAKMGSKSKRKAPQKPDDWKQQRRKQRRIREREKEKRFGEVPHRR
jgi:hypothetical protein